MSPDDDRQFERDVYQLMGEIRGFMLAYSENNQQIRNELRVHREEIFGDGPDGGIKGRIETLEMKIYVVGAVALSALALASEPIASALGGLI